MWNFSGQKPTEKAYTLEELKKANANRDTCIKCGKVTQVLFSTEKYCPSCENALENPAGSLDNPILLDDKSWDEITAPIPVDLFGKQLDLLDDDVDDDDTFWGGKVFVP